MAKERTAEPQVDMIDYLIAEAGQSRDDGAVLGGRISIEFWSHDGHMVPEVHFYPVGRINANHIEQNLALIYREIQRAQSAQRDKPIRKPNVPNRHLLEGSDR